MGWVLGIGGGAIGDGGGEGATLGVGATGGGVAGVGGRGGRMDWRWRRGSRSDVGGGTGGGDVAANGNVVSSNTTWRDTITRPE